MIQTAKQRALAVLFAVGMSFMLVPIAHGAQTQNSTAGFMLRHYLQQQGVAADLVPLQRLDGFTRAIRIQDAEMQKISIGFTDTPYEDGLLLLITPEGESILQANADGSVRLISGQQIDIRYILCLLNAGLSFFDDAKACPQDNTICYIQAVLSLILYVMDCNDSSTTTTIPG